MPRGVRDGWRVWAVALVAAAIAVAVSLLAAGPVAAVSAASHYDTAAYSYDAPALLSSPDTVADVATDPSLTWVQQTGRAGAAFERRGAPVRYVVEGVRDGIKVRVILQPGGEGIITGLPVP